MKKVTIISSNRDDTQYDIVDKLEKALNAIKHNRESKHFTDKFLLETKATVDSIIDKIFDNMIKEISIIIEKN